jgi:acetyl-CoA C-acetyltransferase
VLKLDAVIVSAVRTPIGKYNKSLRSLTAPQLGSIVIKEAIACLNGKLEGKDIEEVIMGNVLTAGIGQAPARQAALAAGLSYDVAAVTVNKVCGSGLKAVMLAAQAIRAGDADVIIAGGQESMSNTPYYLQQARFGYFYGNGQIIDGLEHDGLRDAYSGILMGITGEIIAEKYNITREAADMFALQSHQRAVAAKEKKWIDDEIVPVKINDKKREIIVNTDDGPRADTSFEALQKIKPAFKEDGIVTAGNASSINDGAAAVVVMSKLRAQSLDLDILATIKGYNTVGVKPDLVMEAPIHSVKKLLDKQKLRIGDIDVLEHNEAFASASVAVKKELGVPDQDFNPRGGAVALGHPLGASGARILVTLISEMKRREAVRGICTLCLGGGNAVSMLIER